MSGRSGSGKTLVLERVRRAAFPQDEVKTVMIDCWEETSSINALNKLIRELQASSSQPKIVIVDHFEKFNTRRDQKLLYSVLNASQTHPWFVVMVCSTEDAIDNLEKRIKSRLSKIKINFNVRFPPDQVEEAFLKFVNCTESEDKENSMAGLHTDWHRVSAILGRIRCRDSGLRLIKQLAAVYSLNFSILRARGWTAPDILEHCTEAVCPRDEMVPILETLSLRQLCLLRCVVLLQKRSQGLNFTYVEVWREYSKFCKNSARTMEVDTSTLYRDIDELVRWSILNSRGRHGVGLLAHRRISLDVQTTAISEVISKRTVPTNIRDWLEDS